MGDSERGEFLMWKVNIICRKPFDFAQDVADAPFFFAGGDQNGSQTFFAVLAPSLCSDDCALKKRLLHHFF